ncbi:hypothetical protein DVR12_10115 [Chitinophaga silvatica]|uniref:2TM domain-containing protein n=1 Tax=Chitinophaga silvatica TaxID=2282649 RepID=A0A3E1YBC5_9BACT|nr:hypothetical protein [Chitinophaga silvatica]RFS23363.1 hypothetical protein DVR12_10115 [Chitinophaga silvatica]
MEEEKDDVQPKKDEEPKFDWELMEFFLKIIRTIFVGLFLMLVNITLGLYLGFGVPEESTPGRMIFFYSWLVITLAAYIYYVWKMWKHKMKAP